MKRQLAASLFLAACLTTTAWVHPARAADTGIHIQADNIGGVVTSAKGPEAGVWVIAETRDFPSRLIKIVVTDDQGRYVMPQLPKAKYKVWVRGFGLVDSQPVEVMPGKRVDLTAVVAPDGRAAAQVYPAEYWLALAKVPQGEMPPEQFAEHMKTCMVCHQLGSKATREIPPATHALGTFQTSLDIWDRRTKSGPVGGAMSGLFLSLGDQRKMLADWSDSIAAGEYPKDPPPRPTGVERNLVVTQWEWGSPTTYSHDAMGTDTRTGLTNPYGKLYGPTQYEDSLLWIDPVKNEDGVIHVPSEAAPIGAGAAKDGTQFATSPFLGDRKLWVGSSNPRSAAMDPKGRIYFAFRAHDPKQPDYCKTGSSSKYAQYFPINDPQNNYGLRQRQIGIYDPKTDKFETVDSCFTTDHNQFADNKVMPGNNLFFGQDGAIGWVSVDTWDKTHDPAASTGWLPFVLDTNGDGKISTGWTEPNEPIDPKKDHRVKGFCYSIAVSSVDGSVWCSGIGNTRTLIRVSLGKNPPETAVSEIYEPPALDPEGVQFLSAGGVDVDSEGVVWQNWRETDQITSFDRRKCKVLKGPTATGQQCPEGWTTYRMKSPRFPGTKIATTYLYLNEVDRDNATGLGKDTVLEQPNNSDGVWALLKNHDKREWIKLAVPYPMGQQWRRISWRIDDPKAGWKGRGLWTSDGFVPSWHQEGGMGERPKVVHIQVRPDPLAN